MKVNKIYDNINIDDSNNEMVEKIQSFMDDYEKYLDENDIGVKFWRLTGTHFTHLRAMMEDVKKFKSSTDKKYNL